MNTIYNSQIAECKTPFGAVPCGTAVNFTVKLPSAEKVHLHGFDKTVEMAKSNGEFTARVTVPKEPCLVHYYFEVVEKAKKYYIVPKGGVGGEAQKSSEAKNKYQLTVFRNEPVPSWFKGSVMYQIYVDRFYRPTGNPVLKGNILYHTSWDDKPLYIYDSDNSIVEWDFFGGSLKGVTQKLDYIKSLGVDVIYLNPIFEAASNHKYDTGDYSKVDPMYGDDVALKELIDKAKKLGMNIMLDGVFSHTGDDSIYFNKYNNYQGEGAYHGEDSPYYSWYTFKKFPDEYNSWWGVTSLPEVNKNDASYREFLFNRKNGIIKKWMSMGIMGWRLDVADELPDDFIKELKSAARNFCDAPVLLGEVWEDASSKVSYGIERKYIIDDSMDSVSNYPLREGIIDYLTGKSSSGGLCAIIMSLQENYPADVFHSLMNLTGTHDSIRLATLLGEAPDESELDLWQKRKYELGDEKLSLAIKRINLFFIILFTLPGNPCIYYGDETAVQGYKDPYNRSTFPWKSARDDIRDLMADLAEIRNENTAFKNGFFTYEPNENEDLLRYSIVYESLRYTVIINRSQEKTYKADIIYKEIMYAANTDITGEEVWILPFGGAVIKEG